MKYKLKGKKGKNPLFYKDFKPLTFKLKYAILYKYLAP